jgi:hypothetical protein
MFGGAIIGRANVPIRHYSGEKAYPSALRSGPARVDRIHQLSYQLSVIGLWLAWIGTAATKFHLPQS